MSSPSLDTFVPPTAPARADAGNRSDPMSVLGALNALLRRRWSIAAWALTTAVAVVGVTLLLPRTYTSAASFIPQAPTQQAGGLSTVASQFGISVGEMASTDSPAFYAGLIASREILGSIAESTYTATIDGVTRTAPLAELLEVPGQTPELRRHRTIEYLNEHVGAAVTPKTGAVVLSVTTESAALSRQLADAVLAHVVAFNRERRQSRVVAERRFTEERLAEARAALGQAERQLEAFLLNNRRFTGSPTLEFERDRLAREVSVRSQRYLMMSEAFERARIEEVRDTPVITVIESPETPVLANRRMLALKAVAGFLIGLVIGVAIALIRHLLAATQRSRADEYAEFLALRRAALADLKRPWRPLTGRRASA